MTREQLDAAVKAAKAETKDAMQLLFDELNQGQQKQIVKNQLVKALFDRYGVVYGA